MTQITADWKDVQQKAYRLLIDNSIECDAISTFSILCTSHGDNGTYQTYVNNKSRVTKDNAPSKANWYCTCPWGKWSNTGNRPHDGSDSTGTVKVQNRFCSHAYAAYLMLYQYRKLHKEEMQKQKEQDQDQNLDIQQDGLEEQQTDSQQDQVEEEQDLNPETEQYADPEQLENDLNALADGTESEQDESDGFDE
jgi:hypothetical protein